MPRVKMTQFDLYICF